jgi:hypothetical protein
MISRSPMLITLPIGHGPGTGITSPRESRRGCATASEFAKPPEVSIPAIRNAVAAAGMTPPFAEIATRLSATPRATTGIPTSRRFATRNHATST